MGSATKSVRTLTIDGMSGNACVDKVSAALKTTPEVSVRSVKNGSAVLETDQAGCDAACKAIGTAGYKAHESTATESAPASPAYGSPAHSASTKPGHADAKPVHAEAKPAHAEAKPAHAETSPAMAGGKPAMKN